MAKMHSRVARRYFKGVPNRRILWTAMGTLDGKPREIQLHATKGYRTRRPAEI